MLTLFSESLHLIRTANHAHPASLPKKIHTHLHPNCILLQKQLLSHTATQACNSLNNTFSPSISFPQCTALETVKSGSWSVCVVFHCYVTLSIGPVCPSPPICNLFVMR